MHHLTVEAAFVAGLLIASPSGYYVGYHRRRLQERAGLFRKAIRDTAAPRHRR